jgi:hypothetical protein
MDDVDELIIELFTSMDNFISVVEDLESYDTTVILKYNEDRSIADRKELRVYVNKYIVESTRTLQKLIEKIK